MNNRVYIILILAVLATSCGEYEKLLKSTDFELKREKAQEYYDEGKYVKTSELLAQVLPRYRATDQAEELNWLNANTYYQMRDYMMAGSAFRNFANTFPYSEHTEEATFMTAYCDYMMSPRPELDQAYTHSAIEAFTFFQKRYPSSDKVDDAQDLIKELQDKLVEKSYINAKLYYDMKEYRAAVVALDNSLKDYPNTKHREELMFLKLESSYLFALNSVAEKQQERFQTALDEYYSFVEEFPESDFRKDVDKIYSDTARFLKIEETTE
ncbi:MAG TPA: outer membrane protein assembly factor BamD [Bacteroidales bacterium]|nr:outer membrane protein assembly factor BamD [Bacteroidales bacterium]